MPVQMFHVEQGRVVHHRDTEEHGGPQRTGRGFFITETRRSTEGHKGLQNLWLKTSRHAEASVAFAVSSRSGRCGSLWPSVLLCVFVMKETRPSSLVPRPSSPSPHRDAYCFTAQRTDTVSTTFSSPGFTGVGSSLAARPTDRTISILMGMGASDGPLLEISISAPSW